MSRGTGGHEVGVSMFCAELTIPRGYRYPLIAAGVSWLSNYGECYSAMVLRRVTTGASGVRREMSADACTTGPAYRSDERLCMMWRPAVMRD